MNSIALAAYQVAESVPETALETASESSSYLILAIWVLFLAIFVGFEVITKVPPTLHTPLMSGANAISGITIVGALYCAKTDYSWLGQVFGFLAIAMAMINVVGGFLVTDRMLRMFGGRGGKA